MYLEHVKHVLVEEVYCQQTLEAFWIEVYNVENLVVFSELFWFATCGQLSSKEFSKISLLCHDQGVKWDFYDLEVFS